MLKISYADCPVPSAAILVQFTLKMCDAAGNRQKHSLKTLILEVQVHSSSSMLTTIISLSIAIACHDKQHVCAYLQQFSRYTSQ